MWKVMQGLVSTVFQSDGMWVSSWGGLLCWLLCRVYASSACQPWQFALPLISLYSHTDLEGLSETKGKISLYWLPIESSVHHL